MKKNLWIWALAAFSMVACTSEDAPTPKQVVTENDWISPDGQVLVQLSADGITIPTANVGRATGPLSGTEISVLDDLGIFALAENAEYTAKDDFPVLLDNEIAKGTKDETIDGELHKDTDGNPLSRIRLYKTKENRINGTPAIYYYPITTVHNYNFYGYHPYQEDANVTKTANDVKVAFSMDKGDIDLITGISKEAATIADKTLYVEEKDNQPLKGNDTDSWNGYNARYIRKIKYSNELVEKYQDKASSDQITQKTYVPNIHFKHRTSQLRFFIVANDKQSTEDKLATGNLRVKKVQLLNIPIQATWSLTTDVVSWTEPTSDDNISISMKPTNTEKSNVWEDEELIKPAAEITDIVNQQSGYLMVAPRKSYELQLTIVAPDNDGNTVPEEQETKITIQMIDEKTKESISFEEGKYYNIYIQLNALQEVNIHAELEDWQQGNDVFVPVE